MIINNQPSTFYNTYLPPRTVTQQRVYVQGAPLQNAPVYFQQPKQQVQGAQFPVSQIQQPQARVQLAQHQPRILQQQPSMTAPQQPSMKAPQQPNFVPGQQPSLAALQQLTGLNPNVLLRNKSHINFVPQANNPQGNQILFPTAQLPRAVSYGQLNYQAKPLIIINAPTGLAVGRQSDLPQYQVTERREAPKLNPQGNANAINNDLYERAQVILQNKIDEIVNETIEKTESIIKYSMTPEKDKSKLNKSFSSSKKFVMTPDFEGEILEGERDGVGVFKYQNGWKFEGQWEKNFRNGFGVLYDDSGKEVYTGDWLRDKYWGHGILRNRNKEESEAPFDFRNFDNIGERWERYEGEFLDGKFDGLGTLYLTNGERYGGKFKKGKIEGEGTFYSKPATITIAVWENNKLLRVRTELRLGKKFSLLMMKSSLHKTRLNIHGPSQTPIYSRKIF